MTLKSNEPAPDFSVLDQNNHAQSLKSYQGKWLLLYFYPKDFTSGCTTEANSFRDYFAELSKRAEIVGVSADSAASHRRFAEKHHLPYTLLSDSDKLLIHAYGTDGLIYNKRTSFLISPDGIIKKIYKKVNPQRHVAEILADLEELQK